MTSATATSKGPEPKLSGSLGQVVLLAAGLFVLLAISTLSVVLVNQSRKDNGWVVHTVEAENQLNSLMLEIRRAESATRGYMLSSGAPYLSEYQAATAAIPGELDNLGKLTMDNPVQVENVAKLREQQSVMRDAP